MDCRSALLVNLGESLSMITVQGHAVREWLFAEDGAIVPVLQRVYDCPLGHRCVCIRWGKFMDDGLLTKSVEED